MLVPTGVWKRIWKRLESCAGTNSCRRKRTMPSEATKKTTAPSITHARWCSAGCSQRR